MLFTCIFWASFASTAEAHTHTHTHTYTRPHSVFADHTESILHAYTRPHSVFADHTESILALNANHAWTLRPCCINSLFMLSSASCNVEPSKESQITLSLFVFKCAVAFPCSRRPSFLIVNVKSKHKICYFLSQFLKIHDKEAQQGSDCAFHSGLIWTYRTRWVTLPAHISGTLFNFLSPESPSNLKRNVWPRQTLVVNDGKEGKKEERHLE
jgi:hypothetical protein